MDKKQFFLKLIPPRPSFSKDMTDEERSIMNKHIDYWMAVMNTGMIIAYGPVFDPNGAYGIGIIEAESEENARDFAVNDPAPLAGLGHYEIYPMKAVTPGNSKAN